MSADVMARPWALQVGRIFGIPIRLHATFLLLLVWVALLTARSGESLLRGLVFLLLLMASVTLHELGHALVAWRHGVGTDEIVLLPIGGVSRLRGRPSAGAELAIALAGPLVNLGIALAIGGALLWLGDRAGAGVAERGLPAPGDLLPAGSLLPDLALANFALFAFNLLPVSPLDGARALRAFLALAVPGADAARLGGRIGQLFAVSLGVAGALLPGGVGLPLLLLAILLFFGATQEGALAARLQGMAGRSAADAMVARFERLAPQEPLEQAALLLLRTAQQDFPVIDAWGRPVGALGRGALLAGLARLGGKTPVLEAMDRRVLVVAPETPLGEVVSALRGGMPSPAVVAGEGGVVGIVTLDSSERMLALLAAMGRSPRA
jgi:stage IV sporulation protein FB